MTSLTMIGVFDGLKTLVKISRTNIDNVILRLHYSVTVILLLSFCAIVTAKQYVGDPIDCVTDENIPPSIINTFCWIHTTYTIPKALIGSPEVPYPGIDGTQDENQFKYHRYYQWVSFVLFIQAILFYIPRWLWKSWEAGKIETLSKDLNIAFCSGLELRERRRLLVDYLNSSRGNHDSYTIRFLICEVLALINVVSQIYVLDKLFDGEFRNYGLEVISFLLEGDEERIDPMARIFPKITKCRFYRYGPSAGLVSVDALCILPLNIINEKIYTFLWFWFLGLTLLTALLIVAHIIIITSRSLWSLVIGISFSRQLDRQSVDAVIRKSSFGDWFLIYMLAQNIDPIVFKEVIHDLAFGSDSVKDDYSYYDL